jgi:hypothetical protein
MLKTLLILTVGIAIATAVTGSAASLTNTVAKVGADTQTVSTCDNAITTSWTSAYDATLGKYKITNVTVGDIDGTNCNGATLKVTLANSSNASLGEQTATIASTDTSKVLDFSGSNIPAADVTSAATVLVGP